MQQTEHLRQNGVALRTDLTVLRLVVGKLPCFIFQVLMALKGKVCHVITVKKISEFHQLFSKYGNKMTFIQGLPYPYTTNKFFSQLILQAMCDLSIPKSHKPKRPNLHRF